MTSRVAALILLALVSAGCQSVPKTPPGPAKNTVSPPAAPVIKSFWI